jgi:hypothetical protein
MPSILMLERPYDYRNGRHAGAEWNGTNNAEKDDKAEATTSREPQEGNNLQNSLLVT